MTEGTQGVQAPIVEVKELSPEKEIMALVAEICHEIDTLLLSEYLVGLDWEKILGKPWAHLKTNQEKAEMISLQAKVCVRPPIARARPKQ